MTYVTIDDMADRVGGRIQIADRALIAAAIDEACAAIDVHCAQTFTKTATATPRTYAPTGHDEALIDPFWTTTGLIVAVDAADDGTWSTIWANSDIEPVPFGGGMAAMFDAPYDRLRALGSAFPTGGRRTLTLKVTAQWGWAAPPTPVVAATKIVAHDLWKRKDVAFGIATSGVAEFGGLRVGRDVLASVASLLAPFQRVDRTAGIA